MFKKKSEARSNELYLKLTFNRNDSFIVSATVDAIRSLPCVSSVKTTSIPDANRELVFSAYREKDGIELNSVCNTAELLGIMQHCYNHLNPVGKEQFQNFLLAQMYDEAKEDIKELFKSLDEILDTVQ